MNRRSEKRPFIYISSSSEEEAEEDDDSDGEGEAEEDGDDDEGGDYGEEEGSDQTSSDEEEESNDQGSSDNEYEDENDEVLDHESLSKTVVRLLREGNDLQTLTLQMCKAYLRKHGLRISGTKAECLKRIKEHWRIKDGNGEALYPRSSFIINCTGDVCKGDVVLFKQKVYNKFEKVKRSGHLLGKRTIAGRVVKESYGVARQQHTFTVEVLWSHGIKKLPPLFPLLVKGRNLYRLKTFRQHWKDEAERSRVLAEKHKRGAAARLVRERKRMSKTWSANEGTKCKKRTRPSEARAPQRKAKLAAGCGKTVILGHENSTGPCQKASAMRKTNSKRVTNSRSVNTGCGKTGPLGHRNSIGPRQKAASEGRANSKRITNPRSVNTSQRHWERPFLDGDRPPAFQPHSYHPLEVSTFQLHPHHHRDVWHSHRSSAFCYPSHELGSTSATPQGPHFRPYANPLVVPAPMVQRLPHGTYTQHPNSNHRYGPAPSH